MQMSYGRDELFAGDDAQLVYDMEQRAEARREREEQAQAAAEVRGRDLANDIFDMAAKMNAVAAKVYGVRCTKCSEPWTDNGHTCNAVKLAKYEGALLECLEYFEDRYDVVDGDYGQPKANREMQMGQMIEEALGRRP
jgi:hypothetical protein